MPCSRSARRPSVSSERSIVPLPLRRRLACATCSSWSARTALESKSSRPISVDLPSSTEPAVASRRVVALEVAGNLAVLHRGLADAVVGARLAALGDPGARDLDDDVVAEREDALLGPRALLVAARAAERGVEPVLLDRVEQRDGLQPVARGARPGLLDGPAGVDRGLHAGHDQPLAELGHAAVAE